MAVPVILIFDVGKTNKKILLFDEEYKLLEEESLRIPEVKDEDGFPCEDVHALRSWVENSFSRLNARVDIDIRGVNFSGYGASFVYISPQGKIAAPLYSYLKPYPEALAEKFYKKYGGMTAIAKSTASPVLGSLNSGMQLYRIKNEQPGLFAQFAFALHLPQFLSYILADYPVTELTSVGCHTCLWDFRKNRYHDWVAKEELINRFAPFIPSKSVFPTTFGDKEIPVGVGLHDSSAALIPYLSLFHDPFVLISTGTWSISLNPFNHTPLKTAELKQDCLCFLSFEGKPVKASRLFAGQEHEDQVKRIAAHFLKSPEYYQSVNYDSEWLSNGWQPAVVLFRDENLDQFEDFKQAYHRLMQSIVTQQVRSTNLILNNKSNRRIFVDGGFGRNALYMNMLARAYPDFEVYAATVAQASGLGAALAMHPHWNKNSLPANIIELKYYAQSALNIHN